MSTRPKAASNQRTPETMRAHPGTTKDRRQQPCCTQHPPGPSPAADRRAARRERPSAGYQSPPLVNLLGVSGWGIDAPHQGNTPALWYPRCRSDSSMLHAWISIELSMTSQRRHDQHPDAEVGARAGRRANALPLTLHVFSSCLATRTSSAYTLCMCSLRAQYLLRGYIQHLLHLGNPLL